MGHSIYCKIHRIITNIRPKEEVVEIIGNKY